MSKLVFLLEEESAKNTARYPAKNVTRYSRAVYHL